jgi:hypothetical protein
MAWRLDEAIIRGELDNRTRGVVTGRIWLAGRELPLELELTGNAWRDLAGRRLEFSNPAPRVLPIVGVIATLQRGLIGDFTASRKIRVYRRGGLSASERGRVEPWIWSNGIHLEWFNTANERVLIEAVSYRVAISPECAWEMTMAEEQRQRELNAAARANHRARMIAVEEELPVADYESEWEQGRGEDGGRRVEEPLAGEAAGRPVQPEVAVAVGTMTDVSETLSAAAMLIRILDTESSRPTAHQCEGVMKRLALVGRELERVRLVVEFCRKEKLAENAWIDEVQREVRLHAAECERLQVELRRRLGRGR